MKAKSIYGKSPEEIEKALQQAMADNFKPTLAIAFVSIKQDRQGICAVLKKEGVNVFGATSCGEFTESHQSVGESVIMLLDVDPRYFNIFMEDLKGNDLEAIAKNLAKNALNKFKDPGFILCTNGMSVDNIILDGDLIIRSIEEVIGPDVNITGGMAGDDWMLKSSFIFTHGIETNLGIAALVFDQENVSLKGMAISGWKPIGISRTITKCEGTFLHTIDNKPALDMYLKYLGATYDDNQDQYHLFENVAQHYPFLVERESGASMMATPMMVDKESKALVCDVSLRQGSKLSFTMPPDFDFVEEVLDKARALKDQTIASAEAMLIFSCAGRVTTLGPLANLENQGLAEVWQTPMVGFYTYGEFGRALHERPEFHSTTNSWVVIKEK